MLGVNPSEMYVTPYSTIAIHDVNEHVQNHARLCFPNALLRPNSKQLSIVVLNNEMANDKNNRLKRHIFLIDK